MFSEEAEDTHIRIRRWLTVAPRLPKLLRQKLLRDVLDQRMPVNDAVLPLCKVLRRRGWSYSNIHKMVLGKRDCTGRGRYNAKISDFITGYEWDQYTYAQQQLAIKTADKLEGFLVANMQGRNNSQILD